MSNIYIVTFVTFEHIVNRIVGEMTDVNENRKITKQNIPAHQ